MNPTDSDYAAFLDRLPELRRLYDPRLHQFEVTKGPGTGDSLERVERYFARVGSVRGPTGRRSGGWWRSWITCAPG